MRPWAFLLGILACLPAFGQVGTPGAGPALAGKVGLVEGGVQFFDANRSPRSPALDAPVFEGDSIVTAADGEVHLTMEDGGFIAVRPNTKMRIASFRAEGGARDNMTVGLLEGGFRSITGWIARFSPRSYTIRTPTATIGVRGTDHEPFHIPEGSTLGEPGTYDKVNQGGTVLQSKFGRVEVSPGRAAFAHLRRAEQPRVLERVPAHFRASKHEAGITQRYAQTQQRLQQQREERRNSLKQRRVSPDEAPKAKPEQTRSDAKSGLEERREAREKNAQERKAQAQRLRDDRREQKKARDEHPAKHGKRSD